MADWGDGVSASFTVGPLSVSVGNGWPHNALQHHWLMPISCHFRDCKELLVTSLTHVSDAIASVQTFTFTFTYLLPETDSVPNCMSDASKTGTGFLVLVSGADFQ